MPLYSYHCKKCDKDSELLTDFSSTPACPHCGGSKMERLPSRVAPPGRSRSYARTMRAQAAKEGHLSNFSRAERGKH